MEKEIKNPIIIITLILAFLPFNLAGQEGNIVGVEQVNVSQKENGYKCYQWNKPRNWGSRQSIDTSLLSITYNYSFPVGDDEVLKTFSDIDVLQIGHKINRFYSLYSERIDSVAFNFLMSMEQRHLDALTPDWTPSLLQRTLYSWIPDDIYPLYQDVFSYKERLRRTISSRFQYDEYQYTEDIEPLNWIIVSGIDTIMGYPCNKAETSFRGRKWVAYFTFDIPYSFGPWKFSGLPGLILKVVDIEGLFKWEAIGISKPENELIFEYVNGYSSDKRIYVWIPDRKIRNCTRKEMDRLWKRFWNAPLTIQMLDGASDVTFVDGKKELRISLSDPLPDNFYPRIEIDF